jgi:thiol-disulfide isomerase/thioredoxin
MVFIHIDKKNANKFLGKNNNGMSSLERYLQKDHVFLLIYMEGCGPCNAVRPEWEKLKNVLKNYSNNENIVIMDIDKDIVDKINYLQKPTSFPTIKYITNKGKNVENYEDSNIDNKDRTIDSLVEWIDSKTKNDKKRMKNNLQKGGKTRKLRGGGKWSLKYKRSINCKHPKGFSQKQYCKYTRKK